MSTGTGVLGANTVFNASILEARSKVGSPLQHSKESSPGQHLELRNSDHQNCNYCFVLFCFSLLGL